MNQAPHVAIVGATGAVGVEILSCLETRNFPVGSLKLPGPPENRSLSVGKC